MKIALSFLLLMFLATGAHAQTAQIDHIDILEAGIYAGDRAPCNLSDVGINYCDVSNERLTAATTTIPAQQGLNFGVRIRPVGAPEGTTVTLKRVWIYPPQGIHAPSNAQPVRRLEDDWPVVIGRADIESYNLTDPWELVPGVWTFELRDGNRRLVSQQFTVVDDKCRSACS